ncbi:hypothetical protein H3C61_00600 [Candidatus Gracilibacteria bacterium]|nr:hypothetical protein [Candidatus Gracilibacteria bacterium]
MKNKLLISLLLLLLTSCGTNNNKPLSSSKIDTKINGEQIIIDNFFEKSENNTYKSLQNSKIINGLSIYEKSVYFKKDNSAWFWSFDQKNWISVSNKTMKCDNKCDSNGLSPNGNNLKIINELEKYSKGKTISENNEIKSNSGVIINNTDKKSVFDFLDEGLICNDNVITVSGFADISCVVVDNNIFNNSMDILNKYFYAEKSSDGIKKYYYNNSANYLSVSDIKDNKVTINLYINTNYSSEKNFIQDKIDFVNYKDKIGKQFLENINQNETKVDFDQNIGKVEKFLTLRNELKFDRFYKNIKVYDINSDYLETLYFDEKDDKGLTIKFKSLENIDLNGISYESYLIYSTSKFDFSFESTNKYGYVLFNPKTKKVYLMKS